MKLNFIERKDFYKELFEKCSIPTGYKTISHENNIEICLGISDTEKKSFKAHSYQYFPDYLSYELDSNLFLTKVFQKSGYAANLKEVKSVEDYLQKNCKTNFRGNVKRSVKKMESCLNINYKMFYGEISKEVYLLLMDSFYKMLIIRFQQRNDKNLVLENWEYYLKNTFDLINKRKASLFVIYNTEEPIAFSINFHFKNIFYFAIPTFNIDYSKFAPGNVVIFKNLEWCFDNGFNFFDMGYGGFENKINWCNTTYNFEHHVVSKNKKTTLYTAILKHKYSLINFLISKNLNTFLKRFKKKKKNSFQMAYQFSKIEDSAFTNTKNLIEVCLNRESNQFLKKPINDYLYLNNEYLNNILVYEIIDEPRTYVIKGKNKHVKFVFINDK